MGGQSANLFSAGVGLEIMTMLWHEGISRDILNNLISDGHRNRKGGSGQVGHVTKRLLCAFFAVVDNRGYFWSAVFPTLRLMWWLLAEWCDLSLWVEV